MRRLLQDEVAYSFCYTTLQVLHPDDFQRRTDLCDSRLQQYEADNTFFYIFCEWMKHDSHVMEFLIVVCIERFHDTGLRASI